MRLFSRLVALGLLILTTTVAARPAYAQVDDPDTEIARRRFQKGIEYYATADYEKALAEFEAARRVKAAAALDYNIARCLDRLERLDAAIKEYEKYVAAAPNDADTPGVKERITVLKTRLQQSMVLPPQIREQEKPPEPSKPPPSAMPEPAPASTFETSKKVSWAPAIGVGAAALGVAVIGAGLLGSVGPAYNKLERECGSSCAPSRVDPLASRAKAGYAAIGIAGVLAIADVIVIAVTIKRRNAAATHARQSFSSGWSF